MLVHLALLTPIASVCVFERPPEGTGALHWLDLDRDGDVDLLAIGDDGGLRYLRQESARRFVDVSIAGGLDALRGVRALVAADLDGDGLPDLVVGCEDGARVLRQTKGGAFEERTGDCGLEGVGEVRALERIDLDGDGGGDLVVSGPSGRRFFHDRGDLRFEPLELGAAGSFVSALDPSAIDAIEVLAKETSVPAAASDASSSVARPPIADASDAAPSASASGAPAATLGLAGCIKSISDQALPGSCLEASSIPELGLLYPLSPELNVDAATGFVGINTTSADTRLHVVGQGRFQGGSEASTAPGTGMLQVLSFDALSGIGIDSNELQVWGTELSINPQGSFGTRINESLFVQPGELVGIGKPPSAGIALDVDGVVRADDTIVSTKPGGAPFLIASQDLNANLNADLLDGLHASAFSQLGSSIETGELADAAVTDAKVAAGIAGAKVVPDFGAQDVRTNGRIGVGTSPTFELEVAGTADVDVLRIAPGASSGYVLTSDAGGWASWQPAPSAAPDTDWIVSGNDMHAGVSGRVGIGTSAPTASLHVASTDGMLAAGTFGQGTIPVEGPGARMMWYPRKAAFRAGQAQGQWDDALIGPNSVALGLETTASGAHSTALGYAGTASGFGSTAVGLATRAQGQGSLAVGIGSTAFGDFSTAAGWDTVAGSFASYAIGRNNVGSGSDSSWHSADPLFEIGNGASDAMRSNALTVLKNGNVGVTTATPAFPLHVQSANSSAVVRAEATASSGSATGLLASSAATNGIGLSATVSSGSGTPIAVSAVAPLNGYAGYLVGRTYATSLGVGVLDPAVPLHVGGGGDASPSGGGELVIGSVTGQNLALDGNELMARSNGATAALNLNAEGGDVVVGGDTANGTTLRLRSASGTPWKLSKSGQDLAITNDSPASASIHLDLDAGVGVGRSAPAAALDVQAVASGDLLRVRNQPGATQVVVDPTGAVGIGVTNPGVRLDVAGDVRCVQLVETSDARMKREVRALEGALESVLALRAVSFEWDRERIPNAAEGRQLGFLAQEVRAVLPEAVRESADGTLSVSYSAIVPVLAEGVGELHAQVRELELAVAGERAERERLADRLARIETALAGEQR